MPDGSTEQIRSLTELQRISVDVDTAIRLRRAFDTLDAEAFLPRILAPTLVIHARNNGVHPLSESLRLASELAGAQLLVLESHNHVLVESEPAWRVFFDEVRRFLEEHEASL